MPVVERVRADGSKAYLAQIDIVRKGERYRENRTFDKKRHAEQWIKTRSRDISELVENGQGHELKTKGRKLSDAIQVYLDKQELTLENMKQAYVDEKESTTPKAVSVARSEGGSMPASLITN